MHGVSGGHYKTEAFDPRDGIVSASFSLPRVRQQANSKLGLKRKSMDEEGPNGSRDKKVLGKKRPAGMWCHCLIGRKAVSIRTSSHDATPTCPLPWRSLWLLTVLLLVVP